MAALGFMVSLTVAIVMYITLEKVDWILLLLTFIVTFLLGGTLFSLVLERYVSVKIKPIYQLIQRTKKYQVKGSAGMADLDTEVKAWVENSQRELADYQLKEDYRREFIGNVSHELKTPIFNIQGYVMTLLDGALYDEKYNVKYLNRAMKSVERMIDLVEDLEMITKLESRGVELDLVNFDMKEVAKDVIDALELKASGKSIKIKLHDTSNKQIDVRADKKKIRQVLENLIVNAVKYGNEGGEVALNFIDLDDHWLVEVIDDGIGIHAANLSRVFERFYRADKGRSREQGGSGLGLSIVKHIVEAHGHTVSVRSTLGEGSVFSFTMSKAQR